MTTKTNEGAAAVAAKPTAGERPATVTVRWDDADITNTYANVCNVSSSREEVVLVFGVNKAWEKSGNEVQVKLSNRIILSPFAAKRLSLLLENVLKQYEARFGTMDLGIRPPDTSQGS